MKDEGIRFRGRKFMNSSAPLSLPASHLGLYIHVPFCVRKCSYCDFLSQSCHDTVLFEKYLHAITREAQQRLPQIQRPLSSIFIGGGTPTALPATLLQRLWDEVAAIFPRTPDAEITMEVNPGTLSEETLQVLATIPLTRVSLGAQSIHPAELLMLGRIHTPEEIEIAVTSLRVIGVPQINIDLMYALPKQTLANWQKTLEHIISLKPDHLSCYALILEEGTALAQQVQAGELPWPDENEEEEMVAFTASALQHAGYDCYEVSNAARSGAICRHNVGYWLGYDYVGLGPAATSTMSGIRWRNTEDIASYNKRAYGGQPVMDYIERLSAPARLLERVMLGLRLRHGFDLQAAETACGCQLHALAGDILLTLRNEGLIAEHEKVLCLTKQGYRSANTVVARLMAVACG